MTETNKAFDVFIACKITDDKGKQTKDAEIAYKLYTFLKTIQIKVFFSTYEIYESSYHASIDNALASARLFFVVGTKKEYLESQNVQNERNTFKAIKKNAAIFCICDKKTELPIDLQAVQKYYYDEPDFDIKIIRILKENGVFGGKTIIGGDDKKSFWKTYRPYLISLFGIILIICISIWFYTNFQSNTFNASIQLLTEKASTINKGKIEITIGDKKESADIHNGVAYFEQLEAIFKTDSVLISLEGALKDSFTLDPNKNKVLLKPNETVQVYVKDFPIKEDEKPETLTKTIVQTKPTIETFLASACPLNGVEFVESALMNESISFSNPKGSTIQFNANINGFDNISGTMRTDGYQLTSIKGNATGTLLLSKDCKNIKGTLSVNGSNTKINFTRYN